MEVGGEAAWFAEATTERDVLEALEWCISKRIRLSVLGGGSNVVVADRGVDGLVLRIGIRGVDAERDGDDVLVTAGAGEPWDSFVGRAVEEGWAGIECLSGIPGCVGATPIQNVGAYGQEVSETVVAVRAIDQAQRRVVILGPEQCHFSYRDSLFKSREPGRYIVVSVTFRLTPGGAASLRYSDLERRFADRPAPSLQALREAVLEIRASKSMVIHPSDPNRRSCGSFFVNPVLAEDELREVEAAVADSEMPRWRQDDGRTKLSAGWLIRKAGFDLGQREGKVGLSSKHALAVVAHEGATAAAVVAWARTIRARVEDQCRVRLVPEPQFWGFDELDDRLPR